MTKKRILVADPSSLTIRTIFRSPKAEEYEILTVTCATECLSQVSQFKPHLVILELLLPEMHGLEVLKKIRAHKENALMGIVIASSLTMIQNHHAAESLGANFFLVKPFGADHFFNVVERFFAGDLVFDGFSTKMPHYGEDACYHPASSASSSYLKFWGTRGSISVAGPQYIGFGGNTSCVELHTPEQSIILDAGTGIRELGDHFNNDKHETINLLLGHTHWDHITGFPFFAPLYDPETKLNIWSPVGYEKTTGELFQDMLSYGYFPVRLEELSAKLTFKDLRDGTKEHFGDIEIDCHHAKHPGPTLCFKIRTPRTTIGYVSDNEVLLGYHGHPGSISKDHFLLEPHLSLIEFLSDCHTVIHEAQYFPAEYHEKVGWGHSSIANAAALIRHLTCTDWIITHHDPKHTDDTLREKERLAQDILGDCNISVRCRLAYDGLTLPL